MSLKPVYYIKKNISFENPKNNAWYANGTAIIKEDGGFLIQEDGVSKILVEQRTANFEANLNKIWFTKKTVNWEQNSFII